MRDVYAIFGTLLALGIAFPGWLFAWWLLFPSRVEQARRQIKEHTRRSFIWGAIGTIAIALVFKLLPNASVSWRDVFVGGAVTAVLLEIGTILVAEYISEGTVGSAFEAAGIVAVLLIAIYFLAQFFIFGIVFTRVFADTFGGGIHLRKE